MDRFDRATIAGSAILIPSIVGLCMKVDQANFWGMVGGVIGLVLVASGVYEFDLPGYSKADTACTSASEDSEQ